MLEVGSTEFQPNQQEAIKLYNQAASMGNKDSLFNLGLAYQNGVSVQINELKAIDYFKRAASMGHPKSQEYLENLGIDYE